MTTALQIDNLSVKRGKQLVLQAIDLSVKAGEVVGILGPNGAGKSTLIKSAIGLIQLASGTSRLAGQSIDALTPTERAALAAYIPQERETAWPLPVESVVALGRLPHRPAFAAPSSKDQVAIDKAIIETDLQALRHRPVTELSGGERARVLTARALAQSTTLLLADEPTSGLDPAHQLSLLTLFRHRAAAGQAIALSIHELYLAARWCDRLVLLHNGKIVGNGLPSDVLTTANVRDVYGCDAFFAETPHGPVILPTIMTS